ncbi:hypothetical protein M885DRAFT_580514, partial [Pelagophyceae sp. CCMP2097]
HADELRDAAVRRADDGAQQVSLAQAKGEAAASAADELRRRFMALEGDVAVSRRQRDEARLQVAEAVGRADEGQRKARSMLLRCRAVEGREVELEHQENLLLRRRQSEAETPMENLQRRPWREESLTALEVSEIPGATASAW